MIWKDCAASFRESLTSSLGRGGSDASHLRDASDLRERFLARLRPAALDALATWWPLWARADQLAPDGDWRTWLILGGRGAGKTRAGAEWVRGMALGIDHGAAAPARRIALVGETAADVRDVMVEGVSGILAVHGRSARPVWEPSRRRLAWANGAIAQAFSAEEPDSLRGPQFDAAWVDEVAKWRHPEATWDMLEMALRTGTRPRIVATTTPRPIALLRRLMEDPSSVVSRAPTRANRANLAPGFVEAMEARFAGTRLGRQELDGEIVEDRPGALWTRAMVEACRVREAPPLRRIVVAVDPPAGSGPTGACGIVAAGLGADGLFYVLDDVTLEGARPAQWAARAVALYRTREADALVAEVNQGGDMVEAVIREADPAVPVTKVRATRGKWLRAEPVAALYEQGRVRHVGALPALEDQMCDFAPEGLSTGRSPDRLDALVWAITALAGAARRAGPRVRVM
jgi:phage terminase large subunit-like protein